MKTEKSLGEASGSTFTTEFIPTVVTGSTVWYMHFNGRSEEGIKTGSAKAVYNEQQYNNALREEGKWLGQAQAQNLVDMLGSPRYTISLDLFKPDKSKYQLGDIYSVYIDSLGFNDEVGNSPLKLRLYQEDFSISRNGLNITIQLQEDEKTVGVV
jgi:hypothetical protein